MKIIVVESSDACNKQPYKTLFNELSDCPRLWIKADSALLKNNKPFFIPEFTNECSASVYLALRICRMGKSIPARFAYRYYDAYSAVVDFTAEDVLRQLANIGEPWDLAKSFDGSVAVGDFVEVSDMQKAESVEVCLNVNGEKVSLNKCENVADLAGRVIEGVSRIFTIRQGDLLLLGKPDKKPLVSIDDHLDTFLNGQKLLDFNVK